MNQLSDFKSLEYLTDQPYTQITKFNKLEKKKKIGSPRKDKKKKQSQFNADELPNKESVENHTFSDESLNQLYNAIRQLSKIDRAVILLYLEEKSYQEIADIIGTNPNNIGVRIKRIKARLKKLLTLKNKIHG